MKGTTYQKFVKRGAIFLDGLILLLVVIVESIGLGVVQNPDYRVAIGVVVAGLLAAAVVHGFAWVLGGYEQ